MFTASPTLWAVFVRNQKSNNLNFQFCVIFEKKKLPYIWITFSDYHMSVCPSMRMRTPYYFIQSYKFAISLNSSSNLKSILLMTKDTICTFRWLPIYVVINLVSLQSIWGRSMCYPSFHRNYHYLFVYQSVVLLNLFVYEYLYLYLHMFGNTNNSCLVLFCFSVIPFYICFI